MNLYDKLSQELQSAKDSKTYNLIKVLESGQSDHIKINHEDYLNMCSNNYLGFANDPMTIAAFKESADLFGVGPGAVRSISGTFLPHQVLEEKLSKFKGVEATLVVQSGFQANTGLIPTITTEDDLILSDQLNHASIIDAMRLSKAKKIVFKHCDMEDLERILQEKQSEVKGNIFIISDGVFSMDGDIAPLDQINALAKKYHAYTIIDDAHGEGVLGSHGKGSVAAFNLEGQIDIEVGTLSKAFGLVGGFISGKQVLIDYLKQKSRVFLFSSSLPIGYVWPAIKIVEEMEASDSRVKKLWENANYLQDKFVKNGYSIGTTKTPITPFMVGEEQIATDLTQALFDKKILVSPIMYPTVAKGKARIRLMVSSLHTKEELDFVYDTIVDEYNKLK